MQRKYFQLNLDCWTECFLARVGRCEERKERLVVRGGHLRAWSARHLQKQEINGWGLWGREARVPNGLSYRVSPSETTVDDSEIQARQHEKEAVAKKQAYFNLIIIIQEWFHMLTAINILHERHSPTLSIYSPAFAEKLQFLPRCRVCFLNLIPGQTWITPSLRGSGCLHTHAGTRATTRRLRPDKPAEGGDTPWKRVLRPFLKLP